MTAPSASLLVPCYNAAAFLPRLWETVHAQSTPFDEIICYDDASTDDTARVATALGATVIRSESNRGPAYARNRLWQAASSTWVHFHDADDLLDPTYRERVSTRALDEVDVVICNARWLTDGSRDLQMEWRYSETELLRAPTSYLLGNPVGGINGYYRRAILERIGGFDETLSVWEDADLHVRLAAAGARFAVIEEALVTALRRETSLSAPPVKNWLNRLNALRHYARILPADCRTTLLEELEKTAQALVRYGEIAGGRDALTVAASLGGDLPVTSNRFLNLCKRWLGPLTTVRLQQWRRR